MTPLTDPTAIIVHCSATSPKLDIGVEDIRKWHVEGNKWADIGYHFVICRHGEIQVGRPLEYRGAHAAGHNHYSIGVCLVGGISAGDLDRDGLFNDPENNFTEQQMESLEILCRELQVQFPAIDSIVGHRDLPHVYKACPCFEVSEFVKEKGLIK